MIHFTNGDIVVSLLDHAGVPGRAVACADVLHDGPLVHGLELPEWRELRARFLAGFFELSPDEVRSHLAVRDREIEAARSHDEVVLWFEHDLFDQLNLLWLLDALHRAGVEAATVRLIVIGSHPEVPDFHGLGDLSPSQLAALFPARAPLTPAAMDEALAAWREVCAPAPRDSAARAGSKSAAWPWLPGALGRLWEELPGAGDGLSRTERQGLEAIASGAHTLGQAFTASAAREERRYLGDASFYETMRRLARAKEPPITLTPSGEEAASEAALTPFGRSLLDGAADFAAVNGLDRWVGGVRLEGTSPPWRWSGDGVVAGLQARDPEF